MRRFGPLYLLVLLCGCAHQPATTTLVVKPDVERTLLQIEDEIVRANRECDYKYFALIEADEFIYTGNDGSRITRQQDLAGEKDCKRSNFTQTLDEVRVMVYDGFAVLNARATTTNANGQVRRTRFTDAFVWRDGRWQLISGHSTRIAQ